MRKTIVIPTDFSVESLNVLKTLLNESEHLYNYDIIMLHGMHLSDSITDLMFMSRTKVCRELSNPAFEEACTVIRNKYGSLIHSLRKDIFTGLTQAAFDSYLEANKVNDIYVPTGKKMKFSNKRSFDIMPFVYQSTAMIHEVEYQTENALPEKGQVAEVFYNGMAAH